MPGNVCRRICGSTEGQIEYSFYSHHVISTFAGYSKHPALTQHKHQLERSIRSHRYWCYCWCTAPRKTTRQGLPLRPAQDCRSIDQVHRWVPDNTVDLPHHPSEPPGWPVLGLGSCRPTRNQSLSLHRYIWRDLLCSNSSHRRSSSRRQSPYRRKLQAGSSRCLHYSHISWLVS